MLIKLIPVQIPRFWEAIKFTCKQSSDMSGGELLSYLNNLLQDLLSSKSQCFVRFSDNGDRTLLALLISSIQINRVTTRKYLYLHGVYSWKLQDRSVWGNDLAFVERFAREESCDYILFESNIDAIWEITSQIGFYESTRVFRYDIDRRKL